jgi:RNA-binding protein 48
VYTVANESKHLLIFGVPKVNLQNEIKRELQKYGETEKIRCITDIIAQESKNNTTTSNSDCK